MSYSGGFDPFSTTVAPYDPMVEYNRAKKRINSIEGQVETDEQVAARRAREAAQAREQERMRVKKDRKELADKLRESLHDLDDARHDFKLARWAVGGSLVGLAGVGTGWVWMIAWGMVTHFSGGRGGPLSLFIVGLVIASIIEGICLVASTGWAYNNLRGVRKATRGYSVALENSAEYESEMLERKDAH